MSSAALRDPFADPTSQSSSRSNKKDKVTEALKDVVQVEVGPHKALPPISPALSASKSKVKADFLPPLPKVSSAGSKPSSRSSKQNKSQHSDIIDDLDLANLGFHNSGPFDAVAPSRNKNSTKSPMAVFDNPNSSQNLAFQASRDAANTTNYKSGNNNNNNNTNQSLNPTAASREFNARIPMPSSTLNAQGSPSIGANNDSGQLTPTQQNSSSNSNKTNPLLEIWGKHDLEPYEEFSMNAGVASSRASSIWDGQSGGDNHQSVEDDEIITTDTSKLSKPTRAPSKKTIPTPAVLGLPEFEHEALSMPSPPLGNSANVPKRSLSIAQRMRRTRPANGPSDTQSPPSPSRYESGFPTSRSVDENQSHSSAYFGLEKSMPQTPDRHPNDRLQVNHDKNDPATQPATEERKNGGLLRKMSKIARGIA